MKHLRVINDDSERVDEDFSIIYCKKESGEISFVEPIVVLLEGECGDDVTFFLLSDGNLVIEGSGPMRDYSTALDTPWHAYANDIEFVTIDGGVASVGKCAFAGCENLLSIDLPNSVSRIKDSAFEGCYKLTTCIKIPSVISIGKMAFYECQSLGCVMYGGKSYEKYSKLREALSANGVTMGMAAFEGTKLKFNDYE